MSKKEWQQKSLPQLADELALLRKQLQLVRTGSSEGDLEALISLRRKYEDRIKYLKTRDRTLKRLKDKWHNDPAWKQKELARKKSPEVKLRDNEARKLAYKTDPEERAKRKARSAKYREGRSAYYSQLAKEWRARNPERYREVAGRWNKQNPELVKEVRRRSNKRRKFNPAYVLVNRLRARMSDLFKGGTKKSARTKELVGCDHHTFRLLIENRFLTGMTWENRSQWHVDHRVPCALFDLSIPEQQSLCFHFSNLVPRWAADNIRKHKRVHIEDVSYAESVLGRPLLAHEIYKPK